MTTIKPDFIFSISAKGGRIRIRTAVFGEYSRYMTALYLQYTAITVVGLLAVALTVDLSQWLSHLIADPKADGILKATLFIGRYLLLRSADILGRLLPFGCFLGVLWCEMAAILTSQRITIWITGRSTIQCLVPVLVLGGLGGISQYVLEAYLRPMAVRIQTEEHIGEFGQRFDRSEKQSSEWFFVGKDIFRARITHHPTPTFRNILLIRRDREGRVTDVVTADRAVMRDDSLWELEAGVNLPVGMPLLQSKNDREKALTASVVTSSSMDKIHLGLDPIWLDYAGIDAKYLPQTVLKRLATRPAPPYSASEYRTWRAVRVANAFAPFAMALIAATLSLVLLPNAVRLDGVLVIALTGYFSLVSMRSLFSLGERGVVSPFVAAWSTVLVVVAVSVIAIVWQRIRIVRLSQVVGDGG